jgi:hypothetical protein
MDSWIDLHALWKIVVIGILAGAGLPVLFAVGLRALSARPRLAAVSSDHRAVTDDQLYGGNPAGLTVAVVCFAVVLAAIGWGIYSIVSSS